VSTRLRIALWSVLALALYGSFYAFLDWGGPAIVQRALLDPQKEELSFEFRVCKEGERFDSTGPPAMVWEDARTLRISTIAEANCGANWFFGDYSVRGSTLKLEYQALVSRYVMCDCEQPITYRIRGLPKKDYRLELMAQPEIQTGWMAPSLIGATLLIAVLAAFAYGSAVLVGRRTGRNKAAITLAILLAFSAAANLLLWYAAGSSLFYLMASAKNSEAILNSAGGMSARELADRDFAAGTPRWYAIDADGSVPADRPARSLAVLQGVVWAGEAYRKAYVNAYNSRMDRHLPPKPLPGAASKAPAKKG
jgi:hypothetical protein